MWNVQQCIEISYWSHTSAFTSSSLEEIYHNIARCGQAWNVCTVEHSVLEVSTNKGKAITNKTTAENKNCEPAVASYFAIISASVDCEEVPASIDYEV